MKDSDSVIVDLTEIGKEDFLTFLKKNNCKIVLTYQKDSEGNFRYYAQLQNFRRTDDSEYYFTGSHPTSKETAIVNLKNQMSTAQYYLYVSGDGFFKKMIKGKFPLFA